MNSGSDFSITETGSLRAVFRCEGERVNVDFFAGEQQVGQRLVFTRIQAAEEGKRIAETGSWKSQPIPELATSDVKSFGIRLKQYGENGC
jgi:hypothetical protein